MKNNLMKLSIVIPLYYNEKNIPVTYAKLKEEVLPNLSDYEIILVDDGSKDNSYAEALKLREQDDKVKVIKLSRNFGQHIAIVAGLSNIIGDCVVVISADLQDPPELILQMFTKYQDGNKIIIAARGEREDKSLFSSIFFWTMNKIALKNMPIGGFDCFLIDKSIAHIIATIKEKNSSMSQILWYTDHPVVIYYKRQSREIGRSSYTYKKKFKLFFDSILAFSYFPIRLISFIGLIDCILSFSYAIYIVFHKFITGASSGWSSIMVAIFFTSGVQMLMLGIIGEYLWRNFDEVRNRPLYVIDETHGIKK